MLKGCLPIHSFNRLDHESQDSTSSITHKKYQLCCLTSIDYFQEAENQRNSNFQTLGIRLYLQERDHALPKFFRIYIGTLNSSTGVGYLKTGEPQTS